MSKSNKPTSPIDPLFTATSIEASPVPSTLAYAKNIGGKYESSSETKRKADPTRYGDWEKNGRCIDF